MAVEQCPLNSGIEIPPSFVTSRTSCVLICGGADVFISIGPFYVWFELFENRCVEGVNFFVCVADVEMNGYGESTTLKAVGGIGKKSKRKFKVGKAKRRGKCKIKRNRHI